jgi:DNA-binding response OmpR family regulator
MNVLCLEDNLTCQKLIEKLILKINPLAKIDIETHTVSALLYSIINKPDFYILDWSLPYFNTSYIIDKIAKQKRPILIYTSCDLEDIYRQVVEKCGFFPHDLILCQKGDTTTLTNFIKSNSKQSTLAL